MGPYELVFVIGSIAIFGILPPIAVGVWSYKQGVKGREEAMKLRDEAIAEVANVRNEIIAMGNGVVKNVLDGIPKYDIKIPDEQLEELKKSIAASIKGSYGNLIKGAKMELDDNIEGAAQQIADKIPQEQKMAMLGQRMQSAIMEKVMGFLQ